jgi:hypothetical protein
MKIDNYSKLMLTIIAASLFAIAARPIIEPAVARAQSAQRIEGFSELVRQVENIGRYVHDIKRDGIEVRSDDGLRISQNSSDNAIRVRMVN